MIDLYIIFLADAIYLIYVCDFFLYSLKEEKRRESDESEFFFWNVLSYYTNLHEDISSHSQILCILNLRLVQ